MDTDRFADRRDAGRRLAAALTRLKGTDAIVLALPRGGVPVAYEIAAALDLPLDVFIVRKLGVPGHRELAMGAIASGGARVLNQDLIDDLRIPARAVEAVVAEEERELRRRELQYASQRRVALEGRTVVAIAHRLHTAHDADRIAVVIDGRVVELGSHHELVDLEDGEYAALWRAWTS